MTLALRMRTQGTGYFGAAATCAHDLRRFCGYPALFQVVQLLVWPGLRCATSTVSPSLTLPPSCNTRSTLVG